jgi:serine/threonine protein kinase
MIQGADSNVQLDALCFMHSLGVIHRDIKPSNILSCPNEPSMVKLVDFGCAKLFAQSLSCERVRRCIGSPGFASINAHNRLGAFNSLILIIT